MIPKFTTRTLLIAMAGIAIGIAILFKPTPTVATAFINGTFIAILVAACLAAGTDSAGTIILARIRRGLFRFPST